MGPSNPTVKETSPRPPAQLPVETRVWTKDVGGEKEAL